MGGFLFEFFDFSGAFGFGEPPSRSCAHGHKGEGYNNKGKGYEGDHCEIDHHEAKGNGDCQPLFLDFCPNAECWAQ